MKTFQLKVTEDELKAIIKHHTIKLMDGNDANRIIGDVSNFTTETTERIHNLMKRLHKDTPEIERDEAEQQQDNQTAAAAPAVSGWPE